LSKSIHITSEHQLVAVVRDFLSQDHDLDWRLSSEDQASLERGYDAVLRLKLDGRLLTFAVEYKVALSARAVEAIAGHKLPYPPLLITAKLTENILRLCREQGVNCLDLNGRIWIREDGVLIDRAARPGADVRAAQLPPDAFSPKSARLARALLAHKDRTWSQEELAAETQISRGFVSRLTRHLQSEGYIERKEGIYRVVRPSEFLDAWAGGDRWTKRVTLRQYAVLTTDLEDLARRLLNSQLAGEIAFTQWFAANLRFAYTPAPVLSAYVPAFPDESALTAIKARPVDEGGRLWFLVTDDLGVFQQKRTVRDLPLVCDPQIYLDLLSVGLRGPDQAQALRQWEGFCR
jgi:biotin operon repressor